MNVEKITKEAVTIVGKSVWVEGGGSGVQDVWKDTNCHFDEVFAIAKKNEDGKLCGVWGAMSDRTMAFLPWENNFSIGFYLAGVECNQDALVPQGWTKWTLPAFSYLSAKIENNYQRVMNDVLSDYMPRHQMKLVGAIQEFYHPSENGQLYLLFPIERV